mmetsp:Transcript_69014/g.202024  ORF Transcript_69014/g.202024 Transcript_69014/m.202024 type:complete len:482 (+) Transcript_69014:66-1511(+)
MKRLLAALLAAAQLPRALADDGGAVALVQDSLRVRRASASAQASEWWVFGRHRRARQLAEAASPAPFSVSPVRSFGVSEALEPVSEAPADEGAAWPAELSETRPAAAVAAEAAAEGGAAHLRDETLKGKLREKLQDSAKDKEVGAGSSSKLDRKAKKATLYKAGDRVQALDVTGGPSNGTWVDCSITGLGSAPGTYNLFIAAAPPGQQDYSDVPSRYLRRPKPTSYQYKVGDAMQVRVSGEEEDAQWVPCKITGRGKEEDTYHIHVPMAPPGKKDVSNIPGSVLRPYDAAEYAEIEKQLSGNSLDFSELMASWRQSGAVDYAEGETAEVKIADGATQGEWLPCTVLGKGQEEASYRILVGERELPHVHVLSLRKVAEQPQVAVQLEAAKQPEAPEKPEAAEQPEAATLTMPPTQEPPHFSVGDIAEVLVKDGPNKGSWVQVSITGLGERPNSYNIDAGSTKFQNVPAATLRKSSVSMDWDV